MRRWLRWTLIAAAVPVVLAAMVGTALAYPQSFFAYHIAQGRLSLYSDRPFDPAAGRALLARVEARLKTSPLDGGDSHAIFIANADWRQRLFMNMAYGVGGVNFYPWTRNVFLRDSDISHDALIRPNGTPAEAPRTLTYFSAHEIGHSLTGAHLGLAHLWNWRMPQWVREGYADYVGLGGAVDVDVLYKRFRAHDPQMDYAKSGQYTLFRLLTAYYLKREHWSVDRLLTCGMPLDAAVAGMEHGLGAH